MTDLERMEWNLNHSAFLASRLDGELSELEAHVRDPADELALLTVKMWCSQLVRLVHGDL